MNRTLLARLICSIIMKLLIQSCIAIQILSIRDGLLQQYFRRKGSRSPNRPSLSIDSRNFLVCPVVLLAREVPATKSLLDHKRVVHLLIAVAEPTERAGDSESLD